MATAKKTTTRTRTTKAKTTSNKKGSDINNEAIINDVREIIQNDASEYTNDINIEKYDDNDTVVEENNISFVGDNKDSNLLKSLKYKKEDPQEQKVYDQHDYILCRSVTPGKLFLTGKKSGMRYTWVNRGDVAEVEYGDLFAMKNSRSPYLYKPRIIIEDEELLEQPRWKEIKELYDNNYYDVDIDEVLKVSTQNLRSVLTKLPEGLKRAVAMEVRKRVENGEFDSISRLKIIDEVCGTDIRSVVRQ